jgi:hypothetical protein
MSALFQMLDTHGLQEYDACYKEKYLTVRPYLLIGQESRLNNQGKRKK